MNICIYYVYLLYEEELEKVFIIENVKKRIIIEVGIYPYPLYLH